MEGIELIQKISSAVGLPQEWVEQQLVSMLKAKGISATEVTLDHLRDILAEFMQDVLVQAKTQISESQRTT